MQCPREDALSDLAVGQETNRDRVVLGSSAGVDATVVVQVVPHACREVGRHRGGALHQDGRDHDTIAQHPLPVIEVGGCVCRPAEEERSHD